MSDLRVSNLTVDLLQNQGTVALFGSTPSLQLGQPPKITGININVPLADAGAHPDNQLKRVAIQEARRALEEAIRVLDAYPL